MTDRKPEAKKSSLFDFFRLPSDPSSATRTIALSKELHKKINEARERTNASKTEEEWGFFLHRKGRHLTPGKLEKGVSGGWYTLEAYLAAKKKDPTIQGSMHAHPPSKRYPGSERKFSEKDIGVFLEAEDVVQICVGPQSDYIMIMRTKQTNLSHKGIAKEAINIYLNVARTKVDTNITNGMDRKEAVSKATLDTMKVIWKQYNIAVYEGTLNMTATKVDLDV